MSSLRSRLLRCLALFLVLTAQIAVTQQANTAQGQNPAQGPTIQYADDHFAVVMWTTASPGDSRILYGTDSGNLTQVAEGGRNTTSHRVELFNLAPNTTYYLQLDMPSASLLSFETVAEGAAPVRDRQPKLVAQPAATLAEPPRVQYASDSTLVLSWRTDSPAATQVRYGTQAGRLDQQSGEARQAISHRVHLASLLPNATYLFQVETGQGWSDIFSAQTVERGAQPLYDQAAVRYGTAQGQSSARTFSQREADQAQPGEKQIPEGTVIQATLQTPLSTKVSTVGQRFEVNVNEPVRANDGSVAVPAGTKIVGEVTEVEQGKALPQLRGRGKLNMHFQEFRFPDGRVVPLTATLASVHDTKTGEEGEVQSQTEGKEAAKGVGIGAGLGTVAGLIFGSALKGLLIGAVAGGGYVLATQGRDVELPEGTGMRLRLDHAVTVPPASRQSSTQQRR